ncbi:MAG: CHASE domain-containing protein, partial [Amylibacter sp.]
MHKAFVKPTRVDINAFLRSGWIFWSVMTLCVFVTGYAYTLTKSQVEARNNSLFKSITDDNLEALRVRMQLYGHSLDGAAGLIAASDNVTLADWQHYIETLDITNKLPGIRGIGLIIAVPSGEEFQFLETSHTDGVENLQIHPETIVGEKFVIKYIEPLLGNEGMVGFDVAIEGGRRLAATKARETGLPTMTQHIELSHDNRHQPGFLLLRPYYATGMPIDTVEQRRAASKGWVFAPFIGEQLLEKLTIDQHAKFHISVFDGNTTNANILIYSSDNNQISTIDINYQTSENINIFGRNWTVTWHSTAEFDASHRSNTPFFVLLAGLLFSMLYTSIIGALTYREHKVQRLVDKKTLELATIEER